MVFKERTFFGDTPEEALPQDPAGLEARVADMLAAIGDVEASDIDVVARGSTIVLGGYVGSQAESDRAAEATRSIEGVDDVVNQITVSDMPAQPSETRP